MHKLQLEIEATTMKQEKNQSSKLRLEKMRQKEFADIKEQLKSLQMKHNAEKLTLTEDGKGKCSCLTKNPQKMVLDKVLLYFILTHQQQLLNLDQRYLNLIYLLHLRSQHGLEAKQCVV